MEIIHAVTTEDKIKLLARNAKLGDGCLWQHPKCYNSKVVYSSTTPELLEAKQKIVPELFTTGVREIKNSQLNNPYPNSKPYYRLTSIQHPIFTEYKNIDKTLLFQELTVEDLGLWYLDDGCCFERKDYTNKTGNKRYRYCLCIGDCCSDDLLKAVFSIAMRKLFKTSEVGGIQKNNSRATENNKTWQVPVGIAKIILTEAIKYNVLLHKFPPMFKI